MTDRKKNLLVGAVVLVGLILLAWMLLSYGGVALSPFTSDRANITVVTERADGVGEGSAVLYRGIQVGQVRRVRLAEDMAHTILFVQLRPDVRVPSNVEAVIRPQGVIGGNSVVSLELTSPQPQLPLLAAGAQLNGRIGGFELLPKEFSDLATELRVTTQQFRESGVITHLDQAVTNISTQATKAGEILESVNKIVGDGKARANIHQSLENINQATQTARTIAANLDKFTASLERSGTSLDRLATEATETVREARGVVKSTQGSIDQLTGQISERLVQVSGMLDSLSSVARKMDQGKGTAGLIVNDARLYESLVDSAKLLNLMVADLQRLVEQWEEEGLTFRLNR